MSCECFHLYSKDFMCFLVFFLIGLPLSFVSSKILVYNTKLRTKGLIKWIQGHVNFFSIIFFSLDQKGLIELLFVR
jgi:hypothetical protein